MCAVKAKPAFQRANIECDLGQDERINFPRLSVNVDQTINAVYNVVISPVTLSCWLYRHLPFKKKKTVEILDDACPKFSEIPTEAETDKIDAAWPPAPHPVEALSVHDLFRANGKLIRDLCYATTLSEEESEKFLLPVITNLARIVHLTPASEYDHHQGYGGLFTHSLEVAYYAANDAKTTIFDRSASPKELHQNKRRWILTAVLAALTHDIGKAFTDMDITAPNGQHWVQDEPIVDWLRKNGIKSYYISFRPGREHNVHKSASLANSGMLIPKETFTFLGLTGYGEQMLKEFRNALLEGKEGGLIGKILDNADGLSRRVDQLRQRKIRPEFKNVAHPQGDQLLKAIRVLIQHAFWTTNRDRDSRVFNTKQGCYIVWSEDVVAQARAQALDMGFESLPSDMLRLATVLVDAGAAIRNSDEVSNTHNVFWRVTPIVLGNMQVDCIRLADPQLIFDATPPAAIEAIVEGLAVDDVTKKAWIDRWKFLPVQRISREEEEATGYTEDYVNALALEAEEHLREREEIDESIRREVWGDMFEGDRRYEDAVVSGEGDDVAGSGTQSAADEAGGTDSDPSSSPVSESEAQNVNENDGSDGFAGVLPGGMRGRGSHRGQASQKNLKDQKVQSDQSASSGSLAGRVLNGLSSVSDARGGADGVDAGADVVTGSVAAASTETVNSVSDADVANNVLPESKTGRHAAETGATALEGAGGAGLPYRESHPGESATSDAEVVRPIREDGRGAPDRHERMSAQKSTVSFDESGFDMGALLGGSTASSAKDIEAVHQHIAGDRGVPETTGAKSISNAKAGPDVGSMAINASNGSDDVNSTTVSRSEVRIGNKAPSSAAGIDVIDASYGAQTDPHDSAEESDAEDAHAAQQVPGSLEGPEASLEPGNVYADVNDCIEYEDMAIDDEDAARMSGGTAGGASSSYGLNEDDEEAYLYGDVEVEDADMEIEAETFPGDAGEDVVAEAVVASDDKVQPSDDNPAYQTVYFNEPLDDNGKPLLRNRRQAMNEEDGSSSSGHLKTTQDGVQNTSREGLPATGRGKPVSKKEPAPARSGGRSDVDQAYALAEDMVESMQSQMERGIGIWLSDGVTTDSLTGFWRTSSSSFAAAIVESGVDEDLVEMVIDKKISGNVRPRIEWDRKAGNVLLVP